MDYTKHKAGNVGLREQINIKKKTNIHLHTTHDNNSHSRRKNITRKYTSQKT